MNRRAAVQYISILSGAEWIYTYLRRWGQQDNSFK